MEFLLVLFSLLILVNGQINHFCTENATCQGGFPPCIGNSCVCDQSYRKCKIGLGENCTGFPTYCVGYSFCVDGICAGGQYSLCSRNSDCMTNSSCVNGTCTPDDTFVWDYSSQRYSKCSPECKTCWSPDNPKACYSCIDRNKDAISGFCSCKTGMAPAVVKGMFLSNLLNETNISICLPCDDRCADCIIPRSPLTCTRCADWNMTLVNGICFCQAGTGWNSTSKKCEPCHDSCATCAKPADSSRCTSCSIGELISGVCFVNCSEPRSMLLPQCGGCHQSCATCLAPGNDSVCTSCDPSLVLMAGFCGCNGSLSLGQSGFCRSLPIPAICNSSDVNLIVMNGVCKCRDGFRGDSLSANLPDNFCLPCDPACKTCFESGKRSACTSCSEDNILLNGTCVCSQAGMAMDPVKGICGSCHANCSNCSLPDAYDHCLNCSDPDAVFFNGICYFANMTLNIIENETCGPNRYFDYGYKACVNCSDIMYYCKECKDPINCTKCNEGFMVENGTCVFNYTSPCDNTTYYDYYSGECLNCSAMLTNCTSCSSSSYCTNCSNDTILSNGICCSPALNQSCDLGQYYDSKIDSCCKCSEILTGCVRCDGASSCTRCKPGYRLFNGYCSMYYPHPYPFPIPIMETSFNLSIEKCGVNEYYNASLGSCFNCSDVLENCTMCENATSCLNCTEGFEVSSNGSCIPLLNQTCDPGTYLDPFISSCVNCSIMLHNCSECINASFCTKCLPGSFLANTQTCVPNITGICLSGMYFDPTTLSCNNCSYALSGCNRCENSTYCTNCDSQYVIVNGICFPAILANCSTGFFFDNLTSTCRNCSEVIANCTVCDNSSMCRMCVLGSILFNGSCFGLSLGVCGVGFYFEPSISACINCSIPLPNCTNCLNSSVCVNCTEGNLLINETCVPPGQSCLLGLYYNSTLLNCVNCSVEMENCTECDNSTFCTFCSFGNVVVDGKCQAIGNMSCPSGFYLDKDLSMCFNCSHVLDNCTECSNESFCLNCTEGNIPVNGSCISTPCSLGTFFDPNTTSCLGCGFFIPNCLECSNASFCKNCSEGFISLDGVCTNLKNQTCQTGFYFDPFLLVCLNCRDSISGCAECDNSTFCTKCASGSLLSNGACIPVPSVSCAIGTFIDPLNKICLNCSSTLANCASCDNATICTSCLPGFVLSSGVCVLGVVIVPQPIPECGIGLFFDPNTRVCMNCTSFLPNCYSCLNATFCTNCSIGSDLVNGICVFRQINITVVEPQPIPIEPISTAQNITVINITHISVNTISGPSPPAVNVTPIPVVTPVVVTPVVNQTNISSVNVNVVPPVETSYNYTTVNITQINILTGQNASAQNISANVIPQGPYQVNNTQSIITKINITNLNITGINDTGLGMCPIGMFYDAKSLACLRCSDYITNCTVCLNSTVCTSCAEGSAINSRYQCAILYPNITNINTTRVNYTEVNITDYNISRRNITCVVGMYYDNPSLSCLSCIDAMPNCTRCLNASVCIGCTQGNLIVDGGCIPYNIQPNLTRINATIVNITLVNITQENATQINATKIHVPGVNEQIFPPNVTLTNLTRVNITDVNVTTVEHTPEYNYTVINTTYSNETLPLPPIIIPVNVTTNVTTQPPPVVSNVTTVNVTTVNVTTVNVTVFNATPTVIPVVIVPGVCLSGQYFNSSTSNCRNCSFELANCLSCVNSTQCLQCMPDFSNINGSCIPNILIACQPGFFFDSNSSTCINCSISIADCINCINGTICTKCSEGALLNNGVCSRIMNATCDVGTYFDPFTLACLNCTDSLKNCNKCDNSTSCTNCSEGFLLVNSSCLRNDTNMSSLLPIALPANLTLLDIIMANITIANTSHAKVTINNVSFENVTLLSDIFANVSIGNSSLGNVSIENSTLGMILIGNSSFGFVTIANSTIGNLTLSNVTFENVTLINSSLPKISREANASLPNISSPSNVSSENVSMPNIIESIILMNLTEVDNVTMINVSVPKNVNASLILTHMNESMENLTLNMTLSNVTGNVTVVNITRPWNYTIVIISKLQNVSEANVTNTSGRVLDDIEPSKTNNTCDKGQYYDKDVKDCLYCSDLMEGCEDCMNDSYCKNCSEGYVLEANICVVEPIGNISSNLSNLTNPCGVGLFLNSSTQECANCSDVLPNCTACFNLTFCMNCTENTTLIKGACLETCQKGFFRNDTNMGCDPCSELMPNCTACSNSTSCTECTTESDLKDGKCIPKGQFRRRLRANYL